MTLVGLTGGIASGKSAVTQILRDNGYRVMDLDQIARDVVAPGTPGLGHVVDAFGAAYLNLDGSLNRKMLAHLVFNNPKELAKLDALMGPLLWAEVERQRAEIGAELAFLDAALLIEKDMHEHVDHVILVTAPEEIRVRRAMARDNATADEIQARMRAQMSDDQKRTIADTVIENVGTLEELRVRVMGVLEAIRESIR